MRLYSCVENPTYQHWLSGRLKFARQPSSVIDILAIAPFFLESLLDQLFDLRFLRVFRLLRLMQLAAIRGFIANGIDFLPQRLVTING